MQTTRLPLANCDLNKLPSTPKRAFSSRKEKVLYAAPSPNPMSLKGALFQANAVSTRPATHFNKPSPPSFPCTPFLPQGAFDPLYSDFYGSCDELPNDFYDFPPFPHKHYGLIPDDDSSAYWVTPRNPQKPRTVSHQFPYPLIPLGDASTNPTIQRREEFFESNGWRGLGDSPLSLPVVLHHEFGTTTITLSEAIKRREERRRTAPSSVTPMKAPTRPPTIIITNPTPPRRATWVFQTLSSSERSQSSSPRRNPTPSSTTFPRASSWTAGIGFSAGATTSHTAIGEPDTPRSVQTKTILQSQNHTHSSSHTASPRYRRRPQ